jgi:hypothetical protein
MADQAPDWHQDPVARRPGRVEEESAQTKDQNFTILKVIILTNNNTTFTSTELKLKDW